MVGELLGFCYVVDNFMVITCRFPVTPGQYGLIQAEKRETCFLELAHEVWRRSCVHVKIEKKKKKKKPTVLLQHNFLDIYVYRMAGVVEFKGGQSEEDVVTESLLFQINFLSSFLSALVLNWQLKSPQTVLFCARAFPQGDVIHRHFTAPASPTLPLQDYLGNNITMHIEM